MPDKRRNYVRRSTLSETITELWTEISDGFDSKDTQITNAQRNWDMFECITGPGQKYVGEHDIYLPIVHDAIEARVTRFKNAIFPKSGRYVECETETEDFPYAAASLLNHYIRRNGMLTSIPALLRSGDVEGHYTVSVDWYEHIFNAKKAIKRQPTIQLTPDGEDDSDELSEYGPEMEVEDVAAEPIDDIEDSEVYVCYPKLTIHSVSDTVVLPATVDNLDEAEVVALRIRVTKSWLKKRVKEWRFRKDYCDELCDEYDGLKPESFKDNAEQRSNAAGVRLDGKSKAIYVIRAFKRTKLSEDDEPEWFEFYYAGENKCMYAAPLGLWSGKLPVLSCPQEKIEGSFWGKSKLDAVAKQQFAANDVCNMAHDSMRYGVMPIVLTDPEKNPRYASMVLTMAAVWETNPQDTQFAALPQVWKDSLPLIFQHMQQINHSLGVNPSQVPQGTGSKKPSQAEVSQDQLVAIETTADVVTQLDAGLLSPLIEMFFEFDQQFRNRDMTVRKFGKLGMEAQMEDIPPLQWGARYFFRWWGVEQLRSVADRQQKIAMMNILRGMPPQVLNGRKLDVGPVLDQLTEEIFGPRMAPRVLIDERHQMSMEPQFEDELFEYGFPVEVMPGDNDMEHLRVHQTLAVVFAEKARTTEDPRDKSILQNVLAHMKRHMQQMAQKQAAQLGIVPTPMSPNAGMSAAPGTPGVPGGAPPRLKLAPGVAGTPRGAGMPRMGAQPSAMRPAQQPPGAVSRDAMPLAAPRKVVG